jgi:FkbM family methyltransferase
MDQRTALSLSIKRVLRLQPSYSENLQDLWVKYVVAPGKTNGYYLDVGSADGISGSNSKLLDDLGWKGVCIDPFPKNMSTRTCQLFKQPVFDVSGQKVQFRDAGFLGGIETTIRGKGETKVQQAPLVEFTTATLDEILAKANAPNNIDFMSIDIEGAEYAALHGLSFDRYKIEAIALENDGEPERSKIRSLLESKGYKLVRTWKTDDWYVLHDDRYRDQMELIKKDLVREVKK